MLGSETYVHFAVAQPPVVTPDIEELLADTGSTPESLGDETTFTARISSDVPVRLGDRIDLVVDIAKVHFFDPATGNRVGAD
jgi:multiple sugar transport system ATP-binding protein